MLFIKYLHLICGTFLCLLFMTPVHAHGGHDHAHWSADLLHYGFYITMAIMVAVVMFCMVKLLTADAEDRGLREKHNSPS